MLVTAKTTKRLRAPRKATRMKVVGAASVPKHIPAGQTNLTAEERALLPDPNWVTEDDADAIISRRRMRTDKEIPLRQVLKRYGYPLDR